MSACEVLYVNITDITATALLTLAVVLHQALGVLPSVYADGAQLLVLDGGGRQGGGGGALHCHAHWLGLHVVHGVGEVSVVSSTNLATLLEGGTLELHISSLSE